jgi:single-stranded DNA-binding protein
MGKAYDLKQSKTKDDKDTASFNLFIIEKFGEKEKKTNLYVNCYAGLATNMIKYWEEGKDILVEGRIDQYQDKESNYKISINAKEIKFL